MANADLEAAMRKLRGDRAIEKQIMLLKLTSLFDDAPEPDESIFDPRSPGGNWLSRIGAILKRLDRVNYGVEYDVAIKANWKHANFAINGVLRVVSNAIEALKLELQLEGPDPIGSAYDAGQYYDYFKDLREIIAGAKSRIFVVDPYFDDEAFDTYFSAVRRAEIHVLGNRYIERAKSYAEKFMQQTGVKTMLRQSNDLHDRLVIIDSEDCWITGGSIKDAGKKATYLLPLQPQLAAVKIHIYTRIFADAVTVWP